jgi:hypothetical protein
MITVSTFSQSPRKIVAFDATLYFGALLSDELVIQMYQLKDGDFKSSTLLVEVAFLLYRLPQKQAFKGQSGLKLYLDNMSAEELKENPFTFNVNPDELKLWLMTTRPVEWAEIKNSNDHW